MEILNKQERNKSFILFLTMFLVAAGTLIFALFFNFRMPLKENDVLREQNDKISKQFEFSKQFASEYKIACALIDSMRDFPDKQSLYEAKIDSKMKELNDIEKKFSDEMKSDKDYQESNMFALSIGNLSALINARKAANTTVNGQDEINRLTQQLRDCDRDKDELIARISIMNRQNE